VSVIATVNERFEANKTHFWDVPTANEWLAIAGCVDNPYPWGIQLPTPAHASLAFRGDNSSERKRSLRPVETYPMGVAPTGAHDCCGNVHEIVRISFGTSFPRDFRLAGVVSRPQLIDPHVKLFAHSSQSRRTCGGTWALGWHDFPSQPNIFVLVLLRSIYPWPNCANTSSFSPISRRKQNGIETETC
jgi:hypothetical protein